MKTGLKASFLIAAAALVVAATPAAAGPLGVLQDVLGTYGIYTIGDLGSSSHPYNATDSQGPVAVGGSAYVEDFTIAGVTNNGVNALTVAGNLNQHRAQDGGNVLVGGNADFHNGADGGATIFGTLTVNGTLTNAPTSYVGSPLTGTSPIDFASVSSSLTQASALLAAGTGGTLGTTLYQNQWNQKELDFIGTDANLNVFDVSGDILSQIGGVLPDFSDGGGSLHIDIPIGSTAIINVSGLNVSFGHPGNFGFFCNGVNCSDVGASDVLFNFYQAQSLTMGSVYGSILAPLAQVTYTNGQMLGALVAGSLVAPEGHNGGEFHEIPFTGRLAVPTPGALALIVAGLIGLASTARRRSV